MFSGKHFDVSLRFILEAQPYAGRSQFNLIKSLSTEVWEELLCANCYEVSVMGIKNDTNILKEFDSFLQKLNTFIRSSNQFEL